MKNRKLITGILLFISGIYLVLISGLLFFLSVHILSIIIYIIGVIFAITGSVLLVMDFRKRKFWLFKYEFLNTFYHYYYNDINT